MALPRRNLTVNPEDPSAYPSINDAMAVAADEDTILVHPGIYKDPLVIDRDLTLIGQGLLNEIQLHVENQTPITINAEIYHIENISIKHSGDQESFALDITSGRGTISGCDISSDGLACISIHGTASPIIRATRIHDGNETGIMITGQSNATVEGNMIFGNQFAGIEIRVQANPKITKNHIFDRNEVGIRHHRK